MPAWQSQWLLTLVTIPAPSCLSAARRADVDGRAGA